MTHVVLQLNPPIPMTTPKGEGFAHFMIDYSHEDNIYWVVFQDDTGECWTWANPQIRLQRNFTLGRLSPTEIKHKLSPTGKPE